MSSSKTPPKANKAFGIERGPAGWSVVEYEIAAGKVISRKVTEPDVRALALERLARDITVLWEIDG